MTKQGSPVQRPVSIVVDPPGWFTPFAKNLAIRLQASGLPAQVFDSQKNITAGCIAFT